MGVIGAGIVGLSTAYGLLEQGASVTVYERGVPGAGQSGGESRIFRHAHDDPRLVRLACQSRSIWREWEDRLGVELVSVDGVVALGPAAERRLTVLQDVGGVAVRAIDADELSERLPLLAGYSGPSVFDEAGGSIRTTAAIEALVGQLRGSLVEDEVISLRSVSHRTVEVRTGGHYSHHSSVVVCAGRGTAPLARGLGVALPVSLGAHVRLTFAVRGDPPPQLACLQDGSGDFGEAGVYAAPLAGHRHYALGLSQAIDVNEDGSLVDTEGLPDLSQRAADYVRRALPGLDPEPVDYRHCWVTELPWGGDAVGVWETDSVFFIAGHNLFKHAPALGRALASAALGDGLIDDLRPNAKLGSVP